MKKRNSKKTLSRSSSQRSALRRTLLVSLIEQGQIKTTLAKAKELRPFAERMITHAKKGNQKDGLVPTVRQLKKNLPTASIKKIIELAGTFMNRSGGYIRIIKLPSRQSDSAEIAIVEWTDKTAKNAEQKREEEKKEKKKNNKV
jgi:large subunit ribosomal protein L17